MYERNKRACQNKAIYCIFRNTFNCCMALKYLENLEINKLILLSHLSPTYSNVHAQHCNYLSTFKLGVSENHSHRMVQVWKGLLEVVCNNFLALAGSPRAYYYSGLCPDSF